MARDLNSTMAAQLPAGVVMPAILVSLEFRSGTHYVWSGVGPLVYAGNTYLGVGSLGKIGDISEGVGVSADGTGVTLSGIDPIYLGESLTDIKSGGAAKIYLALLQPNLEIYGEPYLLFGGNIDTPAVTVSGETISITLTLENRMVDLGRATQVRYTAASQRQMYPDDIGFNWVEPLNDISLREGF